MNGSVQPVVARAFSKRMQGIVFAMYRKMPFFAVLGESFDIHVVNAPEVPTACVNAHGQVFFDADFVESLSDLQLMFVLAHEVSHVAFGHFDRRGNRDPLLWNCANDFVINAMLRDAFGHDGAVPNGALLDPAFDGLSSEEVYERLIRTAKPCNWGSASGDMVDFSSEIVASPAWPARSSRPVAGEWPATISRAAVRAAQFGLLPAGLARFVAEHVREKVDWLEQLRRKLRFDLTQPGRDAYTFIPCNRRLVHQGLYLPSLVGHGAPKLAFVIDTSASMGTLDIAQAHAEIDAIRRQFACPVYVLDCDAQVYEGRWIQPHDSLPMPHGGGGTDFRPAFSHLCEHAVQVDVVVYLTDGVGQFGAEPAFHVIWVMTSDINPPWGDFVQIHVDR